MLKVDGKETLKLYGTKKRRTLKQVIFHVDSSDNSRPSLIINSWVHRYSAKTYKKFTNLYFLEFLKP